MLVPSSCRSSLAIEEKSTNIGELEITQTLTYYTHSISESIRHFPIHTNRNMINQTAILNQTGAVLHQLVNAFTSSNTWRLLLPFHA